MSRWGKSRGHGITLPLDSLVKEKENANRPTATRSAGTVGKWGVTSFTSIRNTNYGSVRPVTLTAHSPIAESPKYEYQSTPGVQFDTQLISQKLVATVPEAPKPRKFFKSRNTTNAGDVADKTPPQPESGASTSPADIQPMAMSFDKNRSSVSGGVDTNCRPAKTSKSARTSKKKAKIPSPKMAPQELVADIETVNRLIPATEQTQIQSQTYSQASASKRYQSRSRKVINYNEDNNSRSPPRSDHHQTVMVSSQNVVVPVPPPYNCANEYPSPTQSKTVVNNDHPPIVLRISKGTSRLISTDSEDLNCSPSPAHDYEPDTIGAAVGALSSTAELLAVLSDSPPIETLPPVDVESATVIAAASATIAMPVATAAVAVMHTVIAPTSPPSPPSPPKQQKSLKIKIKTDTIRPYRGADSTLLRTTRASRRNQQQQEQEHQHPISATAAGYISPEPEPERPATPLPGTENYELYRTLASPTLPDIAPALPLPVTEVSEAVAVVAEVDVTLHPSIAKSKRSTRRTVNNDTAAPVEKANVREGRVTRKNNNGAITETKPPPPPAAPRSYTRKRKAPIPSADLIPVTQDPVPTIVASTASLSAITLPAMLSGYGAQPPSADTYTHADDTQTVASASESDETEYKIKNKLRRPWTKGGSGSGSAVASEVALTPTSESGAHETPAAAAAAAAICQDADIGLGIGVEANVDKPSVKLVISKKKGSIFKSRALVADTEAAKKRHVYKHKWDDDDPDADDAKEKGDGNDVTVTRASSTIAASKKQACETDAYYEDFAGEGSSQLVRVTRQTNANDPDEEQTSVKCDKKVHKFYTVVRNVKKAHQIQEIGEYQEMDDDVEYILDALQPHNPISTRCLSAIQLASKCMTPAFRMHVRAHGTVAKFFKALQDATKDQSLGLCTATVMFVLSQDTLNMDLDRDALELMLNLLESDVSHRHALDDCGLSKQQLQRNKEKVRELCTEIKSQRKAAHLNLDNITVGTLAMETLLSLTSKRAGEWFKEELRTLGGLEHIIRTICECCRQISDYVVDWTDILLDKLRKIERCLRVLENVTQMNAQNQNYILSHRGNSNVGGGSGSIADTAEEFNAIDTLVKLYKLCDSEIALYPTNDQTPKENPGVVIREALVPTLKVLINLTHPFNERAFGAQVLGSKYEIFDTSLHLLLQAPNYIPDRCVFELSLLVLLLLINLTMHTLPNRECIMKANAPSDFGSQFAKVPAIKALVEYFYKCDEMAKLAEQKTDDILDNPNKSERKHQSQEEVEETVTKLLQKAGHHMEHTMVASYVCILIGHLVMDNADNEMRIREFLRDRTYGDMIKVLDKYYNFMNLTASSEATVVAHIKSTKKIIDYLQKCDLHSNNATIELTSSASASIIPAPSSSSTHYSTYTSASTGMFR